MTSYRADIQNQVGIIDLNSVKEFIDQKMLSKDVLSRDEEKLLDSLNCQVIKISSKNSVTKLRLREIRQTNCNQLFQYFNYFKSRNKIIQGNCRKRIGNNTTTAK